MRRPKDEILDQLHQIAETLNIPLGDLFDASTAPRARPSPAEIARLIEAFTAIPDPDARQRILTAVECEARVAAK